MRSISVVIATMNRIDALQETLLSLEQSSVFPDEVLIVDQSTDPGKAKQVSELAGKTSFSTAYYHLERPSLTAARNYGANKAKHEILVFMDDDVSVQKDTFLRIQAIMSEQQIAMIAGLNSLEKPGKNAFGYFFGMKSRRKEKRGGYVTAAAYGRYPKAVTTVMPTEWAMGYFFAVRKDLLQKWELTWDERLITYGYPEDLDFSYRYAQKAEAEHLRCILHPEVSVAHRVSQEWRETSRAVTFMKVINREYLTYKFGWRFMSRLATRWANFGMFLSRCLKRDRPFDVLKAQFYCDRYRKDIKRGNLHTELYLK